jgi:hypothetical protein
MNKYLLLRDNKQSGPYTVPEIIENGIKPYDLVWLEGKSAAWRYPSEIEELKPHAPVVEEQPFDRFYKKAEPGKDTQSQPEKNTRLEPVIAEESVIRKIDSAPKKVYINFPGGATKVAAFLQSKPEQPPVDPMINYMEPVRIQSTPKPESQDKKLLYGAIAACLILVSLLIINYINQRNNIRQLSSLVEQMQKRRQEESLPATTALANHPISIPSRTINDELPAAALKILPPAGNKIMREKRTLSTAAASAVVFNQPVSDAREKQAVPAEPVKAVAPQPKEPGKEDLFKLVSVKPNKYRTGVLGGISNLQLVLTNNSNHELQRVAVEIRYLNPEKKVVKTQTVYFEKISPGSQPALDVPKSNRGITIDYNITDIKSQP